MEAKEMTGTTGKKARIEYLDVAKGIGIMLVVWAHARAPYMHYIYLFHMPFFFLISGYLFNNRNSLRQFVLGKIKTLYLPFVVWNLAATAIRVILKPETFDYYKKIAVQIILTLNKDGQFFGATWFLGSLFIVSVCYKLLDTVIHDCAWKREAITLFFIAGGVIGFEITFKYLFSRTLVLGMFYAIGYFVRENQEKLKEFDKIIFAAAAFLIFLVLGRHNSAGMATNEYGHVFAFVIGALLASYVVIYLSRWIANIRFFPVRAVKKICMVCGKRSIDILIWQFVAFRIVIAIQLNRAGIPLRQILDFYPVYSVENGWWLAYFLVGMIVPIIWGLILDIPGWIFTAIRSRVKAKRKNSGAEEPTNCDGE